MKKENKTAAALCRIGLMALVCIFVFMFATKVAELSAYAETSNNLEAFTNQDHDNDFERLDFNRDFVVLQSKVSIDGKESKAIYFHDSLKEEDYARLGGKKNIKLEYHRVTTIEETYISMPFYDKNRALGVAGNFHIIAFDEFDIQADCNGNILTNKFCGAKNFGTKGLGPNEASYIAGQYTDVTSSSVPDAGMPLAVGNTTKVSITDNGNAFAINGTKIDRPRILYQDGTMKFIDLGNVKSEMMELSNSLASLAAGGVTRSAKSDWIEYHLNNPESTGVINIDAKKISELSNSTSTTMMVSGFETGKSGSVVINVDMAGVDKVTLPERSYVTLDNKPQTACEETTYFEAGRVLWNFENAEGKTIIAKTMIGSILAPQSDVIVQSNVDGTIIARKVSNSAESHRRDFVGEFDPEEDPEIPSVPPTFDPLDGDPEDPKKPVIEEPEDPNPPHVPPTFDPLDGDPDDPEDPKKPDTEDPEDPKDPGDPSDPKDPEDPKKPVIEEPEDPNPPHVPPTFDPLDGDPEDPEDPGDPGDPEDPEDTKESDNDKTEEDNASTVETGDHNILCVWIVIMLATCEAFLLVLRRRIRKF